MMLLLRRLTELAARKGLDDLICEPIYAHSRVMIDADGKLLGVEELPKGTRLLLPREALRSSDVISQILWDKPAYLFGHPSKKGKKTKLAEKRAACQKVHARLAELAPKDARIRAAAAFVAKKPYKALADQPDGNYVLYFEKDADPIGSRPSIRKALERVTCERLDILGRGICPVMGVEDDLLHGKHAKIKPLAGAQTSGASLVSFDPKSSWSWGHKRFENMVIGRRALVSYTTALRWLLSNQRVQLTPSCTAVWWTDVEHPFERVIGDMLDGRDDAPWEALCALQEMDLAGVRVHFAHLVGSQGRAHVPYYAESSAEHVAHALLDHADRFIYGSSNDKIPTLRRILTACSRPASKTPLKTVRHATATGLFRSAIGDGQVPVTLAHDALTELSRRLAVSDDFQVCLDPVRLRALWSSLNPENGVIHVPDKGFDIQRLDPPYVLGSLFAVMEHVQYRAIASVSRNKRSRLAERSLREAVRHPRRVFPHLQVLCRQHLAKMAKKRLSGWYYLDEVYLSVVSKIHDLPTALASEGQALFMLGYDHTRQQLRYKGPSEGEASEGSVVDPDPATL